MDGRMRFTLYMGLVLGIIFLNIPPALDTLMALYSVSYTDISILISALLWSHALMQVPAGIITDRIGLKKTLFFSIGFMGIGGFIPALVPTILVAVLGRVIVGIGTGLNFTATMKLIALYAPGGRIGAYQAFFAGAFSLGSILAYLFIPFLAAGIWQAAYLSAAVPCLLLFGLLMPMDIEHSPSPRHHHPPVGPVFRIRLAWVLGLYHALSYGSILSLGNWLPTLLSDLFQGPGAAQYAWGGVLVMFISGIGRLAGGFILYRIEPAMIANGSIAMLTVLFTGLFFISSPGIVLLLAVTAALFAAVNFGSIFHIASGATRSESLGLLFGLVNLIANLGAVAFTLTFGWAKDTFGSLSGGFGVLAVLSLTALVIGSAAIRKDTAS
jgi:MFS transporter, NNP family, nitrate/nitrite transporter